MILWEVIFIINEGERVEYIVEARNKNEAYSKAMSYLCENDIIHDMCAGRYYGAFEAA